MSQRFGCGRVRIDFDGKMPAGRHGRLVATSDALGWRVTVGEDAGMSHWAAGRKAPAALNLHIYHAFRAGAGISAQIVITAGTARWPPPSLSVANLVQIGIGSPARIGRVPATS